MANFPQSRIGVGAIQDYEIALGVEVAAASVDINETIAGSGGRDESGGLKRGAGQ